jgi:hypothetical protein
VRHDPSVARAIDGRWVAQSQRDLLLLAFRLGETELRCANLAPTMPAT